jgi:hypothetical protein
LFYFEELKKKPNSIITGRTVSALLTGELLEKKSLQKLNIRNSGSFIEKNDGKTLRQICWHTTE